MAPYFWGHMAQATTRLALAYMMVWSQAMKLGSHFTIIRILHCPLEKEMACQALQYPCLGNPKDQGAWQATVHGVTKRQM